MASTFDETKKINSNQSPCQSWFTHIGIEKSNNFSLQFFSVHRNKKTSSKSDDSTDLSTTDQGNGQDTGLDEDDSAEDPDPDLYPAWSNWNELCLVDCKECGYLYTQLAFKQHIEVRHKHDDSLQKKPEPTPVPELINKEKTNGKKSVANSQTKTPGRTDNSKHDTQWDPGGQDKLKSSGLQKPNAKRKNKAFGNPKRRKQSTESENKLGVKGAQYPIASGSSISQVVHFLPCGNPPSKNLVINQSTNSIKDPFVNNIINSKTKNFSNFEDIQNNRPKNNIFLNHNSLPSKIGRLPKEDGAKNKVKCVTGGSIDPNSDIIKKGEKHFHNGKRFNGMHEGAQRIPNVKRMDRSENNADLKFVDGSKLISRNAKPEAKLKIQHTRETEEKPKTALTSPVYEQFLPAIKLESIKIKKALSSINRVCKARTIEQFRTFSHLKGIMPCSKNSPLQRRVSCSVNTGAKSACFKSWNKVPFRYVSRKCFFPLNGNLQANTGLVLSDSPYKTLRATFDQDFVTDVIPLNQSTDVKLTDKGFKAHFVTNVTPLNQTTVEKLTDDGFVTNVTPLNQSTDEFQKLTNEGFVADKTNVNEGGGENVSSPIVDSSPMNGVPDSGYLSSCSERDTKTIESPINSSPESYFLTDNVHKPTSNDRDSSHVIIHLNGYNKDNGYSHQNYTGQPNLSEDR